MKQKITQITLVVRDYDEAIDFYTRKLDFKLLEDSPLSGEKRWVRIAPPGTSETSLLLAKATTSGQSSAIGNQTGGRVAFFLHTDDFWRDYRKLMDHDIKIIGQPREEEYGTVVVFEDLYGNKWDLIEPR